jgi:hypothetical protein
MAAGRADGSGLPPHIQRLRRVNPTAAFLAVLLVTIVGLLVPGVPGAVILFGLVGLIAALLGLTWAATAPGTRVLRVVILLAIVVLALTKIV